MRPEPADKIDPRFEHAFVQRLCKLYSVGDLVLDRLQQQRRRGDRYSPVGDRYPVFLFECVGAFVELLAARDNTFFHAAAKTICVPVHAVFQIDAKRHGAYIEMLMHRHVDRFENFFDESDFFSSIEMGWTSAPDRLIFDNIHATLWNTDGSEQLGVNDGWGVAGSATWYVEDQWLPFIRGGYSEDGGALLEASVSAGLGWQPKPGPGHDILGVGLNWGRPNSDSFGSGLDDQWTGELFYRINLGKHFAITPNVQLLIDPALNSDEDFVGVFGLRGRLAF